MTKAWIGVLAMLVCSIAAVGCKSADKYQTTGSMTGSEKEPPWVTKPGGVQERDGVRYVYGAGFTVYDPNRGIMLDLSGDAATASLARFLETRVQAMVTNYMASSQDFYDPSTRSSIQNAESVTRTIVDQSVRGATQQDSWTEDKTGNLWVLKELRLDDFLATYRSQLEQALIRDEFFEKTKEKKDAALQKLDEQIQETRTSGLPGGK